VKETTKNEFQLMERIVEMSVADDFQKAKLEWILVRIYKQDDGQCLCGHSPIINNCVLKNKLNGQETIVGSSCVQKFIGIQTNTLFMSYTLISKDNRAYLGLEFIEYLHEHSVINDWEYEFLKSTFRKKFEWLSEKQQEKRIQINQKVIAYMTNDTASPYYPRSLKPFKPNENEQLELMELTRGPGDLEPEWYK
jgi:hypothetical protein